MKDSEYYNSMVWMLENDPEVLELTFSVDEDVFGEVGVCGDWVNDCVVDWLVTWLNRLNGSCDGGSKDS